MKTTPQPAGFADTRTRPADAVGGHRIIPRDKPRRRRALLRHLLPALLGLAAALGITVMASHSGLAPLSPAEMSAVSCGRQPNASIPPGC